jgi:substrate import-associated zinc metallohydrolase lipoprotein
MKNNYKMLALLLLALVGITSCSKEDSLGESNIVVSTKERKGLDKWIYDAYIKPFNIEVKYLWDDSELDMDKKLVPPMMNMVQPFLEVIQKVWIEPYSDANIVPDQSFLKKLSPKQLVLVGSLNYNTDGTVTLGTAEGGRKIVLYEVNNFSKTNKEQVTRMLHTMQHEFGHILHQTKMYPLEFKKITPSYTTTWKNYTDADSRNAGYITSYARSSADEDFVEIIAAMLTMSRAEFNAFVYGPSVSPQGKAFIKQKEVIVVNYYKTKYNIDIYQLQQRIVDAMTALNAVPPVTGVSSNYGL